MTATMDVCLVVGGDETGGLETHFADLAGGLAALGERVAAIAHERFRPTLDDAVRFVPLDLSRGRRNPLLKRRLRRLVDDLAPNVVHAHGGKAAHLLAAVRCAAPLVGTVHGLKKNLAPYRRFDAVIGVSAGVVAALDHPRKTVIHNGVAPPPAPLSKAEARARFAIPPNQTLYVGRRTPSAGEGHRALAAALARRPRPPADSRRRPPNASGSKRWPSASPSPSRDFKRTRAR